MAAPCKVYTTEKLSAFVDGELAPAETAAVRAHAAGCAGCTAALAELRALVANARALDVPEPPPTLWPSIAGELDRRERFAWLRISLWRPFGIGALAGGVAVVLAIVVLPSVYKPGRATPAAVPGAEAVVASAAADPLLHEAETEF